MISTIISYIFVSIPWLIHNLFKFLYKQDLKSYLFELFFYVIVEIIDCSIVIMVCKYISNVGIIEIIVKGFLAVIIGVITQVLFFCNKIEYKASLILIKNIIKHEESGE